MRVLSTLLFAAVAVAIPTSKDVTGRSFAYPLDPAPEPPKLAQTVPTYYIEINNDTRIAYRRFGKPSQFPLVYIHHFRASMDVLDPLFINLIAQNREVIIYDSTGVGHSDGAIPNTLRAMASTVVDLLSALNVPKVDILGFSMGGMISQYIITEHPELINKLVIAGSQPGNGTGVEFPSPSIFQVDANSTASAEDETLDLFFAQTETSRALGHMWWNRLFERNVPGEERKEFVEGAGVLTQVTAINTFYADAATFTRLRNVTTPILVTNGHHDIMAPTVNSYVLQQALPNAELHLYPDSGHGHLFQYPEIYAHNLEVFLRS